ncbi:hypothetical protein [Clostridium botulinum]|uniref:hypothetical protein n=1 Tax=Clostridium botulinum TaxID=1491 RepID=UPI000AB32C49|nr:hypothetical protein [Clostridium botulinum]
MVKWGKEFPKLKIPYYPSEEDEDKGHYEVNTIEEKIVCEYTGYTFYQLEDLEAFEYWLLLRDAIVYNYTQTEAGREYLENCWRLEQTKPDRKSLREKVGTTSM